MRFVLFLVLALAACTPKATEVTSADATSSDISLPSDATPAISEDATPSAK